MVRVENVRAEMSRNKISQKKLAKHLNIATSTMWLKMNGKLSFTVEELIMLSKLFDKEVSFFLNS